MDSRRRKSTLFYTLLVFAFLVITISALVLTLRKIGNGASHYLGADIEHLPGDNVDIWVKVERKMISRIPKGEKSMSKNNNVRVMRMIGTIRRLLGGPGSSPPRCTAKCGRCSPCKPVHVSVPPGTPVTTEYYPEAWRCKCGNRLYMP